MEPSTRLQFPSVARGAIFSLLCLVAVACLSATSLAQAGFTGIFGGGPLYINAANNINELKSSGFTEVIVWSVEVKSNGDLNLNGEFPLTSNGVYIGDQTHPDFASNMALLKTGTVKRITFSIGSSNFGDWQDIKSLVNSQGTGTDSILYKDFAALKAAIPSLDAIDFDDENSFDTSSTVAFGVMLGNLGYKVNPDAFSDSSYWTNVVSQINTQLPGTVDGVHLQAYAGGSGNNPCVGWNFGAVPVWPGLWDRDDTPSQVQTIMSGWNSQCGINGGFMWLYDDFVGNGLAAQYANAINTAVSTSGFKLSGPASVFLNQGSTANAQVTITPLNGFTGKVTVSLSTLPKGVRAQMQGQGTKRKLVLQATPNASTGFTTVTVTGTSGSIKETFTFTLAVSAGIGSTGTGTPVDLSSEFNLNGIYTDGTTYTSGGIDGVGYSYSANLLTTARVFSGVLLKFGPANQLDAVAGEGQVVSLTAGQYSSLMMFGTGIQGNQLSQPFIVKYTDGTTTTFTQSFSDWFTPQKYAGELEGVAMAYRDFDEGTKDNRTFNLYAYRFLLNKAKTVQSATLPNNANVVVLGATLIP
ncbi:MAG: hypothetical protein H0X25_19270 [Acidobacteriales bacterium]|nr:hypothetical protein [Terriglobales bacterium]